MYGIINKFEWFVYSLIHISLKICIINSFCEIVEIILSFIILIAKISIISIVKSNIVNLVRKIAQ